VSAFSGPFHGVVLMCSSLASPLKVFVLGNGSLLDEGISNMLILHSQLNVIRIVYTDGGTLYDLVEVEHPCAIFVNEFDELDTKYVIRLIFSVPSVFVRCVIIFQIENSKLDVYARPANPALAMMYRRKSVVVSTKDDFINFVHRLPYCA
jgi:hypothetical protein